MVKLNYEKNKLLRRGFIQIMSISLPSLILCVILFFTLKNPDYDNVMIMATFITNIYAVLTNLIFWKIFPINYVRLLNYVAFVGESELNEYATHVNPNHQFERIKEKKFLKKSYFNKVGVPFILIGLVLVIPTYIWGMTTTITPSTLFYIVITGFFLPFSISLLAFGIAIRMSFHKKYTRDVTCDHCGTMLAMMYERKVSEQDSVEYNTKWKSYTEKVGTVYKNGEKIGDVTRDARVDYLQRVDKHSLKFKVHCINCGKEKIVEKVTYKYGNWVER